MLIFLHKLQMQYKRKLFFFLYSFTCGSPVEIIFKCKYNVKFNYTIIIKSVQQKFTQQSFLVTCSLQACDLLLNKISKFAKVTDSLNLISWLGLRDICHCSLVPSLSVHILWVKSVICSVVQTSNDASETDVFLLYSEVWHIVIGYKVGQNKSHISEHPFFFFKAKKKTIIFLTDMLNLDR